MSDKDIRDEELEELLTTEQVLDILKISRRTLYRYVEKGALRAYKFGRDLRFKKSDVKAFIEAHEKK